MHFMKINLYNLLGSLAVVRRLGMVWGEQNVLFRGTVRETARTAECFLHLRVPLRRGKSVTDSSGG